MTTNRGVYAVLMAAALWSSSGAFSKFIALDGTRMAFWRAFFAGLVLLALVRKKQVTFRPVMLVMVACFALMNVSFVTAMTKTTAANVIFLQYTSVFFIAIASILGGEPLERENLLSFASGAIGIAILLWGTNLSDQGVWLSVIAGAGYAGVTLTLRKLRDEDPLYLICLNLLGSAFVILAFAMVRGFSLATDGKSLGFLLAFGVLQTAVPYLFFAYGLKWISAQKAGTLTLLEPLLNPLMTYLCVHEVPTPQTLWGGVFLLAGVASQSYFALYSAKQK